MPSGFGLAVRMFSSGDPLEMPLSSMLSSGPETWAAFAIGNGLSQTSPIPFQLAPRLYIVSQGSSDQIIDDSAEIQSPFGDLPLHLSFQDSLSSGIDRSRQIWKSESSGDWTWELTVEKRDGVVQAILVAIPSDALGLCRHTWQKNSEWNPFGSNCLCSDSAEFLPLIISAP
ncbi:MAG: hypothetical protein WCH39_07105 [Schlesneria sp.]